MYEKEKHIMQRFFKEQLAKNLENHKCLYKNCNNVPIKSHVFQKSTIVNQLSINGKVYTFSPFKVKADILSSKLSGLVKENINSATTFPGFCNEHDTSIFRNIEKNVNCTSKDDYLFLYSYRGLMFNYWVKKVQEKCDKKPSEELINFVMNTNGITRDYAIKKLNLGDPGNIYHNQLEKYEELKEKYEMYIGNQGQILDYNNEFLIYSFDLKENPDFALIRSELWNFYSLTEKVKIQKYPFTFGVIPKYSNKPAMFFMIANIYDKNLYNSYKNKFENNKIKTLAEIFDLHNTNLIVINPNYYDVVKKDNSKNDFDINLFESTQNLV